MINNMINITTKHQHIQPMLQAQDHHINLAGEPYTPFRRQGDMEVDGKVGPIHCIQSHT